MYSGPIIDTLRRARGVKASCLLAEDNDPTGYQSKLAIAAKETHKLHTFTIPKRSPDLNVMDYYVWSEVEKRLRKQERRWPASRRESRNSFIRRLRRTACNISAHDLNKAVGDLAWRAGALYRSKGGLFDEGASRQS